MTIESEFKQIGFLNGQHGQSLYTCKACLCVVNSPDRKAHRDKMHSKRTRIIEENAEAYDKAIQEVRHVLVPENESHVFDPGGRAHWDMPRCAVRWCREFEDHPNHRHPFSDVEPLRTIPVTIAHTNEVVGRLSILARVSDELLASSNVSWMYQQEDRTVVEMTLLPPLGVLYDDDVHRPESGRPGQVDDPPHGS